MESAARKRLLVKLKKIMEAIAKLRFLRMAPNKIRKIAIAIRDKKLLEALVYLKFLPQIGAKHLLKLLNSALANAKIKNPDVKPDKLYIKKLTIDEGPTLKRFQPVSRGRAHRIRKRTCHITVNISDE